MQTEVDPIPQKTWKTWHKTVVDEQAEMHLRGGTPNMLQGAIVTLYPSREEGAFSHLIMCSLTLT